MFGRIHKKTILFLICAVIYCAVYLGESFSSIAICLPMINFFFQFQKPQRNERLFSIINICTYIVICIAYIVYCFRLWSQPEYLTLCASILIHTSLLMRTSDVDFEDRGFLSILYIMAIFLLPLIANLIIQAAGGFFLTVLKVLFTISGLGTIAAPIFLIKALLETSAFDSGSNRGEGGSFKLESAAKRAARDVGSVKVINVRSVYDGYEITIGSLYGEVVNETQADLFEDALERQGVDTSVIQIRY